MTHIIIPQTNPFQYFAIRLLVLVLAIALLFGAFEMGYMQSEEDIIEAKGGRNSLLMQQKVLKKQNKELSKEVLHLERKYLLAQEACHIIKSGMSKDLQKIAALEKELTFYKGIVSPGANKKSLYLQSLEIIPISVKQEQADADEKNHYQYKFIIARQAKKNTYAKGSITIFINGLQDNKEVKLSMFSLLVDVKGEKKAKKEKEFKYGFKYFQEFSGIISLPEGMVPQSVDITINSKKKKSIIELSDLVWSKTGGMKYVGQ